MTINIGGAGNYIANVDAKICRIKETMRRAEIKPGTKILNSHMFVVEKYLANGSFDKMKARLVTDGRGQDTEMYPD
jgi:hypothetical protein